MPVRPLLFLHIPKTAGSTFRGVLDRVYSKDRICEIYGDIPATTETFRSLPESERREIDCLRGHVDYGLHPFLPGDVTYVTFLRNPVDRVISHYYYVRRSPNHRLHHAVTDGGVSLREYVDLDGELSNGQAKMIAGRSGEPQDALDPDRLLSEARQHLRDHFAVVGITERFDESLSVMARRLNWSNVHYRRKNISRKRPRKEDVDPDVRRAIAARNQVDQQLYAFANERLNDQVADAGSSLAWDAWRLRATSILCGQYRWACSTAGRLVRTLFSR